MNAKTLLALITLLIGLSTTAKAQHYSEFFTDSTLRLDYIFAGTAQSVSIYPEELNLLSGWSGRRHRLRELPLRGNGQIEVRDAESQLLIYTTSFSSLFQEWITTEEAKARSRSYENVFLIPMPRRSIIVDITLQGQGGQNIAHQRQFIDPTDILIHNRTNVSPLEHEYLHRAGAPEQAIDVAILAEGYTVQEMNKFVSDAKRATKALFAHRVFAENQQHFNVVAVHSPSKDSGVSVPRLGKWLNTSFGSHFDTFYSDRYLTSRRVKAIHNALVGIPYEHIIVLVNSDVYGGGGIYNAFTLTSVGHKYYEPVVVHEFGHSFAGLADEYFYDQDSMTDTYSRTQEPWEQNVTNLIDFEGKKWYDLCQSYQPMPHPKNAKEAGLERGLYEGAAYSKHGFYRCSFDCRMRTNTHPDFCAACHRAISNLIRFYIP